MRLIKSNALGKSVGCTMSNMVFPRNSLAVIPVLLRKAAARRQKSAKKAFQESKRGEKITSKQERCNKLYHCNQ